MAQVQMIVGKVNFENHARSCTFNIKYWEHLILIINVNFIPLN